MWHRTKPILGWLALGCLIAAALIAYFVSKSIGYSSVAVRFPALDPRWELENLDQANIRIGAKSYIGDPKRELQFRPGTNLVVFSHPLFKSWSNEVVLRKDQTTIVEIP